ncbi:aromatic acid decarboxylase [Euryarchaeota archaeon ex4484_178]|nr:MAG: aromatic acid decarboxylase [Euryarchaeota archaeon ex4484_178]
MRTIVAITGASGAIIGIKLLETLRGEKYLIVSENAQEIVEYETDYTLDYVKSLADRVYENSEMNVDIASGTTKFDAMVIAPCSTSTLAKINCGIADNLITRVASVALKEGRKLILVPRETPASTVMLRNMYELSQIGVRIILPVPSFYLRPKNIDDVANYIVGKILDSLEMKHTLYESYSPQ